MPAVTAERIEGNAFLEHLAEHAAEHEKRCGDPDVELRPNEVLRKVRLQLAQFEEQLEGAGQSTLSREVRGQSRRTDSVVQQCGMG